MVDHNKQEVKGHPIHSRFVIWIDDHPRIGWYLAALSALNVLLNLLDLFR